MQFPDTVTLRKGPTSLHITMPYSVINFLEGHGSRLSKEELTSAMAYFASKAAECAQELYKEPIQG